MPPVEIDGNPITGATIDGTDVQEITVDGDVVFSAQQLPVAYSNLVAWYPFDSAEYGGSNADDVTAIIGGSGDDTAYHGSFDSTATTPSYQSSGGRTDINVGANSGAYDFDGNDHIKTNLSQGGLSEVSISAWIKQDTANDDRYRNILAGVGFFQGLWIWRSGTGSGISMSYLTGSTSVRSTNNFTEQVGVWRHVVGITDKTQSGTRVFVDNVELSNNFSIDTNPEPDENYYIGAAFLDNQTINKFDGVIEDVRVYNKTLSASEVNQIYQNTDPN